MAEMCDYKYLRKCPIIEVDTITHNTHFPHSLAKMFLLSFRSCLENIVHNSRIPKEVSLCKYFLCIPNHLEEVSLLQHEQGLRVPEHDSAVFLLSVLQMDDDSMASMLADFVACPPDDEDGASGSNRS